MRCGEKFRIAVKRVALRSRDIRILRGQLVQGRRARIAAACSLETAGGGASAVRSKNTSDISTFEAFGYL
jgi:hypothetical protein